MLNNSILFLLIGIIATTIGAVPFGLVNLSVVDVAINTNIRKSMSVAFGAAVVEIMFALTALLAGTLFGDILGGNNWIKFGVLTVLLAAGIYFWFKKNGTKSKENIGISNGFLKGALLNLISVQVLLFWMVAVTFLSVHDLIPVSLPQFVLFIVGVWLAKMAVLRGYAILGSKVVEKSQIISQNINRIIGVILVLVAVIQFVKI